MVHSLSNSTSSTSTSGFSLPEEKTVVSNHFEAKTLDQLFDPHSIASSTSIAEEKKERLGLFKLLSALLGLSKKPIAEKTKKTLPQNSSIHFAPVLEEPDALPSHLKNLKLPPKLEQPLNVDQQEILSSIENLSDQSMYQIMAAVMKMQSEIAKEEALFALDDFEKFQQLQIYRQKILKEIKGLLLKDEKLLAKFKTAQKAALAVGAVATISSVLGLTVPLVAAAAAIASVTSTAGKAYYKYCSNARSADYANLDHLNKGTKLQINETARRVEEAAEHDQSVQVMSELLRNLTRSIRMIIHK